MIYTHNIKSIIPGRRLILTLFAWCFLSMPESTAVLHASPLADVGSMAPVFFLDDIEGKRWSLRDFKGKVVLLNFWSSWCQPCINELPSLKALQEKMKDKDFVIVSVFIQDEPEKARQLVESHDITFHVLTDPRGTLKKSFAVSVLPLAYIIDKNGVIREIVRGYEPGSSWDSESGIGIIEKYFE